MLDRRLRHATRPIRRLVRAGSDRVDALVIRHVALDVMEGTGSWSIRSLRRARSGTRIAVMQAAGEPAVVVKLTDLASGARQLDREAEVLELLARDIQHVGLRQLIPSLVRLGHHGRWTYLVQRALPGKPATPMMRSSMRSKLLEEAGSIAMRLHRQTASRRAITHREVLAWVDHPLAQINRLTEGRHRDRLGLLRDELHAAIRDARLYVGLIHGDFWSGNVLYDEAHGRISGIVDWDSADVANLMAHDLLHLVLYTRKVLGGTELGAEVGRALGPEPQWDPEEDRIVERALLPLGGDGARTTASLRPPIFLYWIRFVSMNLARQPQATHQGPWIRANVDAVIECV
jgi:aminoglycoside phosphotransferase